MAACICTNAYEGIRDTCGGWLEEKWDRDGRGPDDHKDRPFITMFIISYPRKVFHAVSNEKKPIPHDFFQISVTERVPQIQRTQQNNLCFKMTPFKGVCVAIIVFFSSFCSILPEEVLFLQHSLN